MVTQAINKYRKLLPLRRQEKILFFSITSCFLVTAQASGFPDCFCLSSLWLIFE